MVLLQYFFAPTASSISTNEPNSASQMARHDLLHFSPQIASKNGWKFNALALQRLAGMSK